MTRRISDVQPVGDPLKIDTAGRVPPYNLQAEESLLGAMLLRADAIVAVVNTGIGADDFYKPAHGHVFDAIVGLHRRGHAADLTTVADELQQAGTLAGMGGKAVLITLQAGTPSIGNAASYAEIVRRHSRNRLLALKASTVVDAVYGDRDVKPSLDALAIVVAERVDDGALRGAVRDKARRSRVDGASFILDSPTHAEPVWGIGERVAWSAGEPLLINGPPGVGKTTIAQQVALARLGLRSEVLGLTVKPDARRVLYIAADRPPQAARSMRRMVSEKHRDVLAEQLEVWRGPLPFDLTAQPEMLATMADEFGVGTIVIDSLKDVAAKLSDDETGNRVNQALQIACPAGVEVAALHHQRKRQPGATKPRSLDDVYGSIWLTAGAGSVLLIWGQPGDAVVELSHLKQPVSDIGPMTLFHDHDRGLTVVEGEVDLIAVVKTSSGITATGAAQALFKKETPDPNEIEKARRRLDQLCKGGLARRVEPKRGGAGGATPARYYAVDLSRDAS